MTEQTEQDRQNSAARLAIAQRQKAQFEEARAIVESILGPGFVPTGRHTLVCHDEEERARASGTPMTPAATVITARNGKIERHIAITDYNMRECSGYEDGFGAMLTEPDPVRTAVVKGQKVHVHRYALYWAGYDPGYEPKSAEELAEARERRQEKAVEREAKNNLFADVVREEGYVPKRGKPR